MVGDPLDDNRTNLVRQLRRDELIATRFTIVKPLYRANTFQARDGKHHVRIELVETHVDLDRLRAAVAASSKLDHPNICRVKEFVEADGARVLAMELVDGVSLRDRLLIGPSDPAQVVEWLGQLLSALAYGHAAGIAHGDVSAINVVIDATGTLKVLDFGIVRGPEQATVGADLHAVGALAELMFAGDPAFRTWLEKCTSASNPFTDANAAATALRDPRAIETETPTAAPVIPPHRRPEAKRSRRVGAIVAAGVVATGAIAFWLARGGQPSEPRTTTVAAPTTPPVSKIEPTNQKRPPLPSGAIDPDVPPTPPAFATPQAPTPPPDPAPKVTTIGATLAQVRFPAEAAWIENEAVFVLEEVYAHLAKNPLVRVEIGGHSSSDGKDDDKQRIALWRANAVRDYLQKRGIDEKRIDVRSYGDTKPVATNETAAGRAQNRRVEIRVLGDGPAMASSNSR